MEIKRFSLKMIVVCWLALGAICCCWWSPALALDRVAMAIYNDKLTDGTQSGVWQDGGARVGAGAQGAGAGGDYSQYSFTFYYSGDSQDRYFGYVYAPTSFQTHGNIVVGTKIYNQPTEMGAGALGGYYYFTAIASGYDATYDAKSYITSYFDGDTGKTSYTLYSTTAGTTATNSLYVADRRTTAERGYVYDPAVPASDDYFGNSDVIYDFSTASASGNNFLAQYITDLPYWDQPDFYPGSCWEVAAAIVLSHWNSQGYDWLIDSAWNTWIDKNDQGYVSLITALVVYMHYDWIFHTGTNTDDAMSGLVEYANRGSTIPFKAVEYERTLGWGSFIGVLDAGRPLMTDVSWSSSDSDGHIVVSRGYWNDGHVVADWGWGSTYGNVTIDWNNLSGASYNDAVISSFIDFWDWMSQDY